MEEKEVRIDSDTINLDKFLKWAAVVESGGQAKYFINEGLIIVNGEIETRRGRQLKKGDVIEFPEVFKLIVT